MAEPFSTSPEDFPGIYADDDRVYEEIEAPKFVNFSAPENFLPYDSSWFCTRIGCDQKHEEIDPDTIYKNFVTRVMAARSPNVRLRKSFRHHVQRCPKTEPVKCVNDHKLRFAEKANNARLKAHPISSLRATTPQAKAKAHQSLDAPKDMATPKSHVRPCKRTVLENSKTSSSVAKTKRLGSSSIACSPKKAHSSATSATSTTPKSRLCLSMRKHKIETQKEALKHQLQSSSDCQRDCAHHGNESKVKKSSCVAIDDPAATSESFKKNGDDDNGKNVELDDKAQTDSKSKSDLRSVGANIGDNEPIGSHSNDRLSSKDPDSMVHSTQEDTKISDTSINREDDKENVQAVHCSRDHLITNDDNENTSIEQSGLSSFQKASDTTTQGKCLSEKSKQVLKCKKMMPTNPKPFRFRTDERGILKEANLEKRTQQVPLREIKQAITPLTKKQQLENNVESAQVVESGSKNAKLPCFHSGVDSHSTVNTKSLAAAKGSKTRRVLSTKEEHSSSSVTPSRIRKATTVPKEPNFQKMIVPKNCTKRAVVQAIV